MTTGGHRDFTKTISLAATFAAEGFAAAESFWDELFGGAVSCAWTGYGQMVPAVLNKTGAWRGAKGPKVLFVRPGDPVLSEATFIGGLAEMAEENPLCVVVCPIRGQAPVDTIRLVKGVGPIEVVDGQSAFAAYGVSNWSDEISDSAADTPYTEEGFAALLSCAFRFAVPLTEKPVKLIAVDADNTLWDGVIGEDGPDGIRLEAGHLALHRRLAAAAAAGKIIAIVSKNNPEDVEAAWTSRLSESLPRQSILSVEAGWGPKSQAIGRLLDLYEVDPASAVFLDDNPVECAEVKAAFPSLRTVKVPEPHSLESFAAYLWALDGAAKTDADKQRLETYRAGADRKRAEGAASDLSAFFASLDLNIAVEPAVSADFERIAQLSVRTTQFNASPSALAISDLAHGTTKTLAVRVSDKFGDYGLVGAARYRLEAEALRVCDFLLSCRALGRGVENKIVHALAEIAQQEGLTQIVFDVTETERNVPMRRFLSQLVGKTASSPCVSVSCTQALAATFIPGIEGDATYGAREKGAGSTQAGQVDRGGIDEAIATRFASAKAILEAAAPPMCQRPEGLGAMVMPRGDVEASIATALEKILRIQPIGRHDNWQQMGAKSIHLVRLHGQLRRHLNLDLEIATLFRATTAAELADLVEKGRNSRVSSQRQASIARGAAAVAQRRKKARGRRA